MSGQETRGRLPEVDAVLAELRSRHSVDDVTPAALDLECRGLIACHGPMTLQEIGEVLEREPGASKGAADDLSRERVRQIEASAMRKLRRRYQRGDPEVVMWVELSRARDKCRASSAWDAMASHEEQQPSTWSLFPAVGRRIAYAGPK